MFFGKIGIKVYFLLFNVMFLMMSCSAAGDILSKSEVLVSEILINPKLYLGKKISVIGYLAKSENGNFWLYSNKDYASFSYGVIRSIGLQIMPKVESREFECESEYVVASGVIKVHPGGHYPILSAIFVSSVDAMEPKVCLGEMVTITNKPNQN